MKGEFVIVRALDGPRLCRVLETDAKAVYISSPEQYALHAQGLPALDPVGFQRADVFEYDQKLEKDIARGKVEWKRLTPYKGKGESRKA